MLNNLTKFPIKEEDSGIRLDVILTKLIPDSTRSNLKKIIELKQVKINNSIEESPSRKLKTDDVVEINLITTEVTRLRAMSPLWDMMMEGIDIKSIEWT